MTHNIPFDIQVDIIKRVPVKSLMQFRSVSKPWKSLIDSSQFIAGYSGQQHLLVRYYRDYQHKNVSVVNDDTFAQQKVTLPLQVLVNMLNDYRVAGSSHGLLCLYGVYKDSFPGKGIAVICNISIRKVFAVAVPDNGIDRYDNMYKTVLGFGVSGENNDPKIVKIRYIHRSIDIESISFIPSQVEVFTLSTRAWRSPYSINLPRKSILFFWEQQVVVDGFLYWLAKDRIFPTAMSYNLIMSFDIASEEFREANLPNSLAHCDLSISKLRGSLVVLEGAHAQDNYVFGVWMMEDGVPKSFTQLLTFSFNTFMASIRGFRKSGEPIVEIVEDGRRQLVIYEPHSKHIDKLVIDGPGHSFSVYPYVETLLLHAHSNLTFYNVLETLKSL